MISFLLERGADPNTPVNRELPNPKTRGLIFPGERALHIAAVGGDVESVRVLTRARADPNATDESGYTPLSSACSSPLCCAETVRLLLAAGADRTLGGESGLTPLHVAARLGRIDLTDLLSIGARSTLNICDDAGRTPLFMACTGGHESVVSRLLYFGALQPMPLDKHGRDMLPLSMAAVHGNVGVVRVLLKQGMRAIGGATVLPDALLMAVRHRHARILQLLIVAEGEERQRLWANILVNGKPLLHVGVGYCYPAAVSVLLAAGAEGLVPRDAIGVDLAPDELLQVDRGKEIAIFRMLERGAAYRARSWAWPTDEKKVDADGCGDDGDAPIDSTGVSSLASEAPKPAPVVDVRVFRPESDRKLFMRHVGR